MNILQITIKDCPFRFKDITVKFEDGINLISSKNEAGKSLLLGYIVFALFGTSALRGDSKDYKNVKVNMIFKINNTLYVVDRNIKDTLCEIIIKDDGNGGSTTEVVELTTGKTATNNYISNKLGYKLDVFYKINYSQQLEGDAYATSKKSDRLDLINKINGIDEANKLEKYLETQKRSLKAEIKGLDMSSVVSNIKFEIDTKLDHLTEQDLETYSNQINNLYSHLTRSENIVSSYSMIPKKPIKTYTDIICINPITGYAEQPDTYIQSYLKNSKRIDELNKRINTNTAYINMYAFYSFSNPDSYITEEEVQELERVKQNNNIFLQKKSLLEKGNITCPHCTNSFPLMYESLSSFKNVEWIPILYNHKVPDIARNFLQLHLDTCLEYDKQIEEDKKVISILSKLEWNVSIKEAEEYLNQKNEYHKQLESYDNAISRFEETYGKDVNVVEIELGIQQIKDEISSISNKRNTLEKYLRSKSVYLSSQKAKEQVGEIIELNKKKIEALDLLLNESKTYKLSVQNKCIPTLNKKASELVNKMTGGEHFSLTLSDTFELVLDNKLLSVYSGSTQVVANVAFRIALIELYFKKNFPVFIGDEIDAFADDDRATHIHDSLKVLVEDGYQIILISHHKLNFDGNIIDLAKLNKRTKK